MGKVHLKLNKYCGEDGDVGNNDWGEGDCAINKYDYSNIEIYKIIKPN